MKLLIVEDRPEFREAARQAAENHPGVDEVIFAETYEEAVAKLDSVDSALLDIYLPSTGGWNHRVCAELAAYTPDAPDYVLTAYQTSLQAILDEREKEAPVGLLLGKKAERAGIKFLFVSSLNHHAVKLEAPSKYLSSKRWKLYDGWQGKLVTGGRELTSLKDKPEYNKDHLLFWQNALDRLLSDS